MKKPNKAQKILLLVGLGGVAAVILYMKFGTPATPTAAASTTTAFTGGYDTYNSFYNADGRSTEPPVLNNDKCRQLMEALNNVRSQLSHGGLTPAQITNLRSQEMEILGEMQRSNCHHEKHGNE